ncbi:lipoate--protein ligase family protein [Brevibacillus sp. TJ4]|uniref:lipoate--protein ligase family protein n=1 Tax=Brevibacillus sp. TJ4 TaxID=3234853 RepID=UPI0037D704D2
MSFSVDQPFRWMDSGVYRSLPLEPLILDEALTSGMREESSPIIHLWVYDKALFLGRRDARLPHLEDALRQFGQDGFGCVLRSSGGACVPLDSGVLNMACLVPDRTLSIDSFFAFVARLLGVGLREYGSLQFGEVAGSYCAGEYDFSLHGKKIGGMAQRRTRFGSILQLCINVDEQPRGRWMEEFYRVAGLQEMEQHRPIPTIDGSTVGSIAGLTGKQVSVDDVKSRLQQAISKEWPVVSEPFAVPAAYVQEADTHLTKRLQLFSYTAEELAAPDWHLPEQYN